MSVHDLDEVPRTLEEAPPPRLLGLFDQVALWGNLGISLLLIVAGMIVVSPDPTLPRLSLLAAFTAIVVGAVLGNLLLGLGARELLFGRAELALELPDQLAAVTPDQVRDAAAALREQGRAVLIIEPGSTQPEEEQA